MDDKIKDLGEIKNLFPEMESYTPDPSDDLKEDPQSPALSDKEKAQMKIYVSRDKKHRGGKQVTLIEGFDATDAECGKLLSKLKTLCSAGGSFKDGELIVQGDHVKKVIAYFLKQGFKNVKQKGG
jgi:translation initiation factor 1